MFDEENSFSLSIFFNFRIILVLSSRIRFHLFFKKKDLNGRESIFKQIYELADVSWSFLNLYL